MTAKKEDNQVKVVTEVKRPAKKQSPTAAAVSGLKELGYKVEAWEDKERRLFFFRTEKDKIKRVLSVSQAELESDGFVRNFAARL